jgi:hypothetical protein
MDNGEHPLMEDPVADTGPKREADRQSSTPTETATGLSAIRTSIQTKT